MVGLLWAFEDSSYQFEVLVASSLLVVMGAGAADDVVPASLVAFGLVEVEVAVTPAFFRRRFIVRPSSSSEDVKPESESEAGGGVASRFLTLDFPFAMRFLKETTGASTVWGSSILLAVSKAALCEEYEKERNVLSKAGSRTSLCFRPQFRFVSQDFDHRSPARALTLNESLHESEDLDLRARSSSSASLSSLYITSLHLWPHIRYYVMPSQVSFCSCMII